MIILSRPRTSRGSSASSPALIVFTFGVGRKDIVTSHEGRIAQTARIMADSGWPWNARATHVSGFVESNESNRLAPTSLPGGRDSVNPWLFPVINDAIRLQKPPLPYWVTAIVFKLFGVSEFNARSSRAARGNRDAARVGRGAHSCSVVAPRCPPRLCGSQCARDRRIPQGRRGSVPHFLYAGDDLGVASRETASDVGDDGVGRVREGPGHCSSCRDRDRVCRAHFLEVTCGSSHHSSPRPSRHLPRRAVVPRDRIALACDGPA